MVRTSVPIFQYTLNLSVDVSPIATLFVEHFGQYMQMYNQYSSPWLTEPAKEKFYLIRTNGGFAIRPLPDFQIDVEAGYGTWALAPSDQQEWYVGLGLSWRARFKKKEKKQE